MGSNALRPDGWTSADAAGLPILPGLVRCSEVNAGVIDHALRFTVPHTAPATSTRPATTPDRELRVAAADGHARAAEGVVRPLAGCRRRLA